jgi:hypothetical protein
MKNSVSNLICAAVALCVVASPLMARDPSPAGAEVYIVSPKTVVFGLKGMGVAPAGIKMENTGHHHLLIDTDAPTDLSQPLPATEKVVHFGKGQTETTVTLAPGKHTLMLVLGDSLHVPHEPAVISKKVTITVEK